MQVETERDALLTVQPAGMPAPAAMLLDIKGVGPEFAAVLWSEGLFRHFDNRRQVADIETIDGRILPDHSKKLLTSRSPCELNW